MRHDQIHATTAGRVGSVGSHAGLELPVRAHRDAGKISHLAKSSVAVVVKQIVGHVVVGDEDVLPAVVVVVERHNAQAVARFQPNSGGLADVGECAITVI